MIPIFPLPLSGPRRLNFTVREITGGWDRRSFVRFAARLYRGDRYWPSGVLAERLRSLDPKRNPALAHIRLGLFLAESRTLEETVGAIAVWFDDRSDPIRSIPHNGSFGLFESINEGEVVSALLEAAETWLQENLPGAGSLRGPMELDLCRPPGLLVDGYNAKPAAMMPYNPPYYAELIEQAGYRPRRELLAYRLDLAAFRDSSRLGDPRPGVTQLRAEVQSAEARLDPVVLELTREPDRWTILREPAPGLAGAAWRLSPGSPAVTFSEMLFYLKRLAGWHSSVIILAAQSREDGEAIAFGAAVPNRPEPALISSWRRLAERWQAGGRRSVLPGMASHRDVRAGIRLLPPIVRADRRDVETQTLLLSALLTHAARRGYATAEISPVPADDAAAAQTLAGYGAAPYKTYILYENGI